MNRPRLPTVIVLLSLALLLSASLACRERAPAVEPRSIRADAPPPIDAQAEAGPEVELGALFAPDGSILEDDRRAEFAAGEPILLSIEAGDFASGAEVRVVWTAPGGAVAEQVRPAIAGQSYLTLTAPSAGWPVGDGRVAVALDGRPLASRSFRIRRR